MQKRKADAALREEAKRHKITAEQLRLENARVAELLEARICRICSDRPACAVYAPCIHLAGCYECAEEWRQRKEKEAAAAGDGAGGPTCPLCRERVGAVRRIYFA